MPFRPGARTPFRLPPVSGSRLSPAPACLRLPPSAFGFAFPDFAVGGMARPAAVHALRRSGPSFHRAALAADRSTRRAAHFARDWPGPGGAHIRGGPSLPGPLDGELGLPVNRTSHAGVQCRWYRTLLPISCRRRLGNPRHGSKFASAGPPSRALRFRSGARHKSSRSPRARGAWGLGVRYAPQVVTVGGSWGLAVRYAP